MESLMESKPFRLAISAFIKYHGSNEENKGKYLLIQRSESSNNFKGLWETPGGKIDQGESFEEALVREIQEETGLTVVFDGVAGAVDIDIPTKPDLKVAVLYMKAHTDSDDVKISDEHQDYKWLSISEFPKNVTPALQKMLQNIKGIF